MNIRKQIALCYGTRPQIIKASELRGALDADGAVTAIDTGQHYDFALNELLYQQLGVLVADQYLDVGSGSHGTQTAEILRRSEQALVSLRPDVAVVIGDTNSTLACALAAAKLRIPLVHVEAGLRSHDRMMAEEVNRRVSDAIAGRLCTPSRSATERLRSERPDAAVRETGDVARDVLARRLASLPLPSTIHPRAGGQYIFATLHRAELVDQPDTLRAVLGAIAALPMPTILAVHPRTRRALDTIGVSAGDRGRLSLIPAVGYLESLALTRGACVVLTDSGGLQREAYWLGVPCVTLRPDTEWLETLALGANMLVAPDHAPDRLAGVIEQLAARGHDEWDRNAYGDGHAADRVADALAEWLS
jgi:UDP-N-acetylglucosamine 2-epimerase